MNVQDFVWTKAFLSLGLVPRSGIASRNYSYVKLFVKWLDCFPCDCTILHSYPSVWGSNFSTSPPTLVFICLLDIAILVDMLWHLIVTLICIPWKLQTLSISPRACWPSVHLLWWNVFLDILPISKLGWSLLWSCKSSFNIGRITANRVGGDNGNPGELFQILKDDAV